MTSGPEWEKVERPLLEHLAALGWEKLMWSERERFHYVDRGSNVDGDLLSGRVRTVATTAGPEWEKVERPLLEHLVALGWETLVWSERERFHYVDRGSNVDGDLLSGRVRTVVA